ncbi:TPA: UMP kinase, partial [Thermoplasmata archaeon]|nr:UMP kinase [Thermoplasmata archaeon]
DGGYTADPAKNPEAKRVSKMSHAKLLDLVSSTPVGAGPNVVFDPAGASVLVRAAIPLLVVDGRRIMNLRAALSGSEFDGTSVG